MPMYLICSCSKRTTLHNRPRGYKTFSMLNSTEHDIFLLFINVILTFVNRENSISSLPESEKPEFLDILILISIQNFMLS